MSARGRRRLTLRVEALLVLRALLIDHRLLLGDVALALRVGGLIHLLLQNRIVGIGPCGRRRHALPQLLLLPDFLEIVLRVLLLHGLPGLLRSRRNGHRGNRRCSGKHEQQAAWRDNT